MSWEDDIIRVEEKIEELEKNMKHSADLFDLNLEWAKTKDKEIAELKSYIDEHVKEIHTRSHNQAKPPDPLCVCGHPKSWHSGLTDMCSCGCSQFIKEKASKISELFEKPPEPSRNIISALKGDEDEPDLTSWCGAGDCEIVNYLLKTLRIGGEK